jgi:hypothetical protein
VAVIAHTGYLGRLNVPPCHVTCQVTYVFATAIRVQKTETGISLY